MHIIYVIHLDVVPNQLASASFSGPDFGTSPFSPSGGPVGVGEVHPNVVRTRFRAARAALSDALAISRTAPAARNLIFWAGGSLHHLRQRPSLVLRNGKVKRVSNWCRIQEFGVWFKGVMGWFPERCTIDLGGKHW